MRRLFSAPRTGAASLTTLIIIACGVDTRAPGLLPEEEDGARDMTGDAGTGGAPGGREPSPLPAGGASSNPDFMTAAGSTGISPAGAGGISAGGAAGGMNVGGAAGSAMNVGGAAGGTNDIGGVAGSAMVPSGGAGGSASTLVGNLLLTPEDGWVDGQSNAVGIQGSVFFDVDANLGGPSTLSVGSNGPALCVSGVVGPVQDADYARDWGGLFGIRLGEASPGQIGTWSPITPAGTVSGFTFRLTGTAIPIAQVRIQVEDAAGNYYCSGLGQAGTYSVSMANLRVACWETGGASVTPELPLVSLTWMIIAVETFADPFDFCIEDLTAVLR